MATAYRSGGIAAESRIRFDLISTIFSAHIGSRFEIRAGDGRYCEKNTATTDSDI